MHPAIQCAFIVMTCEMCVTVVFLKEESHASCRTINIVYSFVLARWTSTHTARRLLHEGGGVRKKEKWCFKGEICIVAALNVKRVHDAV